MAAIRFARLGIACLAAFLLQADAGHAGTMAPMTASTGVTVDNTTIHPVPSQDVDNPLRHFYQASDYDSTCTTVACVVVFPATTAKTTLVRHVSCEFQIANTGTFDSAELSVAGYDPFNSLTPAKWGATGSRNDYSLNNDTELYFTAGQQPRIDIAAVGGAPFNLVCTISGITAN